MQDFISAIKSNDLVKATKAFGPIMSERIVGLIESRKAEIARSVLIEGEEPDEDEDEDEDKDEKDESDKDKSEKDKTAKDKDE